MNKSYILRKIDEEIIPALDSLISRGLTKGQAATIVQALISSPYATYTQPPSQQPAQQDAAEQP